MALHKLNLGFIGGALDSAVGTTHKLAAVMDGRWNLCSGCFSTDKEMNDLTGNQWSIDQERIYDDWKLFIAQEKDLIDAVCILTPTPLHKEIAQACIESGYPVICEKAMTSTTQEAHDLLETIKSNDAFLAVTYNYTGYPMVRELKHIIESGQLGKINQINIEMPQEGFLRLNKNKAKPQPQAWRLVDDEIPTLSLDLAVHLHHMIYFLCGEKPLEVVALNNNYGFFENIIDNTICIAKYSNNIDCQMWFGKTALGYSNGLNVRIFGSTGAAEWVQTNPEQILISDNLGNSTRIDRSNTEIAIASEDRYNRFKAGHPAGFIEAFANYYVDLADSLTNYLQSGNYDSKWISGAEVAYEGALMLEAIAQSAKSKKWIKLDSIS